MANFFSSTDVGNSGAYAALSTPSATIPFLPDQTNIRASGGNDIFVSFDGVSDHAKILASNPSGQYFVGKRSKVWVRKAAGAGSTLVDVTAETV